MEEPEHFKELEDMKTSDTELIIPTRIEEE
jgi:hypothetical protein